MSDEFVKYQYGCCDPDCLHDSPEEAHAHIREQRRQWWDGLSDEQRMEVNRLRAESRAYQTTRRDFQRLTTETCGRVQ